MATIHKLTPKARTVRSGRPHPKWALFLEKLGREPPPGSDEVQEVSPDPFEFNFERVKDRDE